MDFWTHQEDARRRSARLIILYTIVVLLLALAAGYACSLIWHHFASDSLEPYSLLIPFVTPALYLVALGFLALVGILSFFSPASMAAGGKSVAEALRGTLVAPQTRDTDERRLYNTVEEMALASGMPVPAVYILKNEPGINAFAAGNTFNDAVIGVTRGALERLTREELQAVVAHEFSHILNGDMKIDLRFATILFGLMCLGDFCGLAMRGLLRGSALRGGGRGKNKGGGIIVLLLLVVVVWITGAVMALAGTIIQAAVTRQREFLADASSVQFTRSNALASALKKIGGLDDGSRLKNTAMTGSYRHMFFCSVTSGLLDTHPPLAERIKRLDAHWDGAYAASTDLPAASSRPEEQQKTTQEETRPRETRPGETGQRQTDQWARLRTRQAAGDAWLAGARQNGPDHAPLTRKQAERLLDEACREPLEAALMALGVLLDDNPDIARKQLASIKDQNARAGARAYYRAFALLPENAWLPFVERAVPALKTFSKRQFTEFQDQLTAFMNADGQLSFREWAVGQLLLSQVGAQYGRRGAVPSGRNSTAAAAMVLSALARVTPDMHQAREAYAAGAASLRLEVAFIETPLNPEKLSESIAVLAGRPDRAKHLFMDAAGLVVAHDHQTDPDENLFLRILSLCLGVPAPLGLETLDPAPPRSEHF